MCRHWRRTWVADDLDIPPRSVVTLQLADVAQGQACPPHHWGLCRCTPGEGCPGWQRLPIEVSEHIPSLIVLAPPASMWLRACRPGQTFRLHPTLPAVSAFPVSPSSLSSHLPKKMTPSPVLAAGAVLWGKLNSP